MEDIFLNADIRLAQEPTPYGLMISHTTFVKLCENKHFVDMMKQTPFAKANAMLSDIKKSLSEFYITKKPINRKERRERAREIKAKILRFKGYCRKHKIRIENPPK